MVDLFLCSPPGAATAKGIKRGIGVADIVVVNKADGGAPRRWPRTCRQTTPPPLHSCGPSPRVPVLTCSALTGTGIPRSGRGGGTSPSARHHRREPPRTPGGQNGRDVVGASPTTSSRLTAVSRQRTHRPGAESRRSPPGPPLPRGRRAVASDAPTWGSRPARIRLKGGENRTSDSMGTANTDRKDVSEEASSRGGLPHATSSWRSCSTTRVGRQGRPPTVDQGASSNANEARSEGHGTRLNTSWRSFDPPKAASSKRDRYRADPHSTSTA